MDVLMVRHAYAGDPDPEKYPDDMKRGITKRGARKFVKAAHGLRTLPIPDQVLASDSVRAWQTARILSEDAGWPKPVATTALWDTHPPEEMAEQLKKLNDEEVSCVGLVGHEPNFQALISYLLTGEATDVTTRIKKGGAVLLKYNTRPGDAQLQWVMPRKALARLHPKDTP